MSIGGATMAAAIYFTNIGPERGPILHRARLDAIGVLESRTNSSPIGMALGWYWDAEGHDLQVDGTWRRGRRTVDLGRSRVPTGVSLRRRASRSGARDVGLK